MPGKIATPNGTASSNVTSQMVWSASYINAAVLQDTYSGGVIQLNSRLYFLQDANWNTTAIVGFNSTTGTWGVTQRYVYSPYGTITILNADWSTSPTGTQPMVDNLYQGMTLDPITGLYYARNRNYDPGLGRWINQDPAGYINGANTYQFVMGNPVGATDPLGLCECSDCLRRALEQYQKNLARTMAGYSQELQQFGAANREMALAQLGQALRNFGWSGLIGAATGQAIGAAADAFQTAINAAKLASLYRIGTATTDFGAGAITEEGLWTVKLAQYQNLTTLGQAENAIPAIKAGATAGASLITGALSGNLDYTHSAIDGLISSLPDPASTLLDAANQINSAVLNFANEGSWNQETGAGRAFGFLARGLQADLAELQQAEAKCGSC